MQHGRIQNDHNYPVERHAASNWNTVLDQISFGKENERTEKKDGKYR